MDDYFLGIDLGSSYTKFVVIDGERKIVYAQTIKTLSRRRDEFDQHISEIKNKYDIKKICTTGYGRQFFVGDIQKTELICASIGVNYYHQIRKTIIDIGGEDIKIIESGPAGEILHFFMNDKCSAGTGTFITEIAEKAEIEIEEMDQMARSTDSAKTINSFCTVFAKSEILGWKFAGVSLESIAKGIYLSIIDRIGKLPLPETLPIYLCGGVIEYHSYLKELLAENTGKKIEIVPNPQTTIALGAAMLAGR